MSDSTGHPAQTAAAPAVDTEPVAEQRQAGGGGLLARNTAANWAWYLVVLVSGFIVPRLVDEYQGQRLLGVWDFAWSLVVYVALLAFGITSAVNRYVARHRARGEWEELNQIINTSLLLLLGGGVLGIAAALGLTLAVPWFLQESSPEIVAVARLLVLLLAVKAALQLPAGVFNGVITGFERFDLLNIIRIARDVAVLAGMAAALLMGYGLIALAAILLIGELLGDGAKLCVARRICPELRLSLRLCQRAAARHVLSFGGKTMLQSLAQGGIYQGSSLIVAYFLGPAALAIFARQRSLVMHAMRFTKQYAQVFIPRSSTLQAEGDEVALRQTLILTTRCGLYVALPLLLILLVLGGPILHVWMGAAYQAPYVLAIMVLGHLLYLPQLGVYSVLMGLNLHGVPAKFDLLAAVCSVILGVVLLGFFGGGLISAAVAMTAPLALSGGLAMPLYACRRLHLSPGMYFSEAARAPVLSVLPLTIWLIAVRVALPQEPLRSLLLGGAGGMALTAFVYLVWVVPAPWRMRLPFVPRLERLFGRVTGAAE